MYRTPLGLATAFATGPALGDVTASITQHAPARMTPSGPVCENGRPFVTDPCTGQAVCLCQMGAEGLSYHSALGSPEGLRALGHSPGSSEASAFRSPMTCSTGLRPDRESWKALAPTLAHHYDHSLALHPYSTFYAGLDLNSAARRKAATRETTSPLKAWLNEHRKNPYPTKAEKIMLAIITKMTMTQVSTWFANARRRLKKENKMCWDTTDRDDDDKDDDLSEKESQADKSEERQSSTCGKSEDDDDEDSDVQLSDISDVEDNAASHLARLQHNPLLLAATSKHEMHVPKDYSMSHPPVLRDSQSVNICAQNRNTSANTAKPKIWSISHILEPKEETPSQSETRSTSLHSVHELSSNNYEISPRPDITSSNLSGTSLNLPVTSSNPALTSSRFSITHEQSSESHTTDGHTMAYSTSMESPRYRLCETSPDKHSPSGQHPRPPLDTPPDTPPFEGSQQTSTSFKESRQPEYEALNLKTERTQESPRT